MNMYLKLIFKKQKKDIPAHHLTPSPQMPLFLADLMVTEYKNLWETLGVSFPTSPLNVALLQSKWNIR